METKNRYKIKLVTVLIVMLITTLSSAFLIYNLFLLKGIETKIRILVILIIGVLNIIFLLGNIKSFKKYIKRFFVRMLLLMIYSALIVLVSMAINKAYSKISNISTTTVTYSSSLITLSTNKVSDIKDVDSDIGILSDTSNISGNVLPYEIAKEYDLANIKEYDGYVELINALYDNEIDYIFLPTNYLIILSSLIEEQFATLDKDTKIIYTEETIEKNETELSTTTLSKPFTLLIMGVDSEDEDIDGASFNGDSLMLMTFNPTTLSTTILSIPRDSYVPIACFANQKNSKITHAAWYGESCMIKTIQNLTGITIDYYLKINFKGVVNLINNLGGVDVDVAYSFCEQDSNRFWGDATVYVKEGFQTLDGEEALAYARNRHTNSDYCSSKWTGGVRNDFIRGQHQQEILKAIINKLKTVKNLNTVYSLLDTISNSMKTNMSTNEILSLYNIGKDVLINNTSSDMSDLISIKKLYFSSTGAYIYDPVSKYNLDSVILYKESVNEVIEAMKINLGLESSKDIKTFSYDIEEEYVEPIIGKSGNYSTLLYYNLLPNFVGKTESAAKSLASSLGITTTIKYIIEGNGNIGNVIYQNYNATTDLQSVNTLVSSVLHEKISSDDIIDSEDDTKTNDETTSDEVVSATTSEV